MLTAILLAGSLLASSVATYPSHNWTTPPELPGHDPNTIVWLTGNMLLDVCEHDENGCVRYVEGVMDGEFAVIVGTNRTRAFCVPLGATAPQAKDIVLNYLRAHPENRQYAASTLTTMALAAAWPPTC